MPIFKNEMDFYDPQYWLNTEIHKDCDNFSSNYYANSLYKNLILHIPDMPLGHIVVLGTNRCVSFELLCSYFGLDRCVGYDLINPFNHPKVLIKDCSLLNETDSLKIAFCHNDIGSYPTTPILKLHCQKWGAQNTVIGGYFLSRNNKNRARIDVENIMESLGFINYQLEDLYDRYDLSSIPTEVIEGHMLSKKYQYV